MLMWGYCFLYNEAVPYVLRLSIFLTVLYKSYCTITFKLTYSQVEYTSLNVTRAITLI